MSIFPSSYWPKIEIDKKQMRDLEDAFNMFDIGGVGKIKADAIQVSLRALDLSPTREQMRKIMHRFEKTPVSSGGYESPSPKGGSDTKTSAATNEANATHASDVYVKANEFINVMSEAMTSKFDTDDIEKSYQLFDQDNKGYVDFNDLCRVREELQTDENDEELEQMLVMANMINDLATKKKEKAKVSYDKDKIEQERMKNKARRRRRMSPEQMKVRNLAYFTVLKMQHSDDFLDELNMPEEDSE